MNDRPRNGGRNSPGNWLLATGVFVVAASVGFVILFGFFVPVHATLAGWPVVFSLAFVIVGAIITGVALGRHRNKSTVVPALIALVCAVLLTVGAGFGYLATCNFEGPKNPSNGVFLLLAVFGVIFCVVAMTWVSAATIARLFRKDPEQDKK